MRLSWIKIGARAAVLVIIYLLLSIPDAKYQYFDEEPVGSVPIAIFSDKLITDHTLAVSSYNDAEKSKQYDSLVTLIGDKLTSLKSEFLTSDNSIIDSISHDYGLASAIIALSSIDPRPLLDNLWHWRNYLKGQSVSWNIKNEKPKLRLASAIDFITQCEDFIVTNRTLHYTKMAGNPASLDPSSALLNIISGDIQVSSYDITYTYLEQAKTIPDLSMSLGLILINEDSSYYISSSPSKGLHIISTTAFISKPFSRRYLLRLRRNLPELVENPSIPHQASNFAFELALGHKVNYDYTYNPLKRNSRGEIGLLKYAYEGRNIDFFASFSPVNNTYLYSLNKLGIKNSPRTTGSEIMFHPAIEVVGQQLSGERIKERNLELASTIANLTAIDKKLMKSLRWKLPYYRILKGYSSIMRTMGKAPPIANGMAPETAIIHSYISDQNEELLPLLAKMASQYEKTNNYFPTYNILCKMGYSILAARESK